VNPEQRNDLSDALIQPGTPCRLWRAGLDLGHATTVYQELYPKPGVPVRPVCSVIPSLIVSRGLPLPVGREVVPESRIEIGVSAERRRDRMEVFRPLLARKPLRSAALLDFGVALRREICKNRPGRPWGVVGCPVNAEEVRKREIRTVAGELFDRMLLVDEPLLIAGGILEDAASAKALVVDLGARGVRATLVDGPRIEEGHHVEVPQGGDSVDASIRNLILQKYPDLVLTDLTVMRMKESLGFVGPVRRTCQMKLVLGSGHRMIDVGDILKESCGILVNAALQAIREAVGRAPTGVADSYLQSIFLVGGGASVPGLAQRIQDALDREGPQGAVVHLVADPHKVLALGALKKAVMTPENAWEIPLFAYRAAV